MKQTSKDVPTGSFADKFRLLYAAACDSRLAKADAGVLAVLCWRYNAAHGCCWPSVGSVAIESGLNERTVQRSIGYLETCGYLHVQRGKGALNRYVLHFGDPRQSRPKPPADSSVTPGELVRQPPVYRPPESINRFLKEKEALESNSERAFSFLGIGEEVLRNSEADVNLTGQERKASPGKSRSADEKKDIRLKLLLSRIETWPEERAHYDDKLAEIEALYLADKQAEAEQ